LGVWKRPFLNKLVSILVCLVYFSVTYFKDISVLALYGPFAILALLTIVLVVGICSSVSDIREFK
jgi:protein-S-isoprenylcysteine O-methyltransferase Ste14